MTKQQSKQLAMLRQSKYEHNKDYFNHRIATIMTMTPLFLEHFEELNEIMPQFFTSNVLKTIEQFSNSLYYKQSNENLGSVADEQINNTEELRKYFLNELK
jgi:hypothetical protein